MNCTSDFQLFGISLLNRDIDEVSEYIVKSILSGTSFTLATPNIDHFVRIEKMSNPLIGLHDISKYHK